MLELWYKIRGLIKPRLNVLWWSIKYGGKENIPPELIFGKIEESLSSMNESLKNALRAMPEDVTEEEKQELFRLISKSEDIERELERAKLESDLDGDDEL